MATTASSFTNNLTTSSLVLKRFLLSQYFSDGVRITLGILLPSIICYQYDASATGIAISLGALIVSIPDTTGPYEHRRNAMLFTVALIFFLSILVGTIAPYPILLGLFIPLAFFTFSMLQVYGARAGAIGTAAIVVVILGIDQQVSFIQNLQYASLILAGGVWYIILSLFTQQLLPYRAAEQVLGECIMHVADFIKLKAGFYDTNTNIKDQYNRIINKQVVINEHQEYVREILFKTRKIMTDTTPTSRKLLLTFIDLVDLYEQTMATHYNYESIQQTYKNTPVLKYFNQVILQMAEELEHIGNKIHNHEKPTPLHHFGPRLNVLKQKIDDTEQLGLNVLVLKKILINLRNISTRLEKITDSNYALQIPENRSKELNRFVNHQDFSLSIFKENLTRSSNHFRHALRVGLICFAAFVFARTFYNTPYSYWILLTIVVILKPGFSLTKKRNYERILGTVVGGIIGLLVLKYVDGHNERFALLTLFMLLSYSFMRIKYVVSVLFMTPYIIIVFSFLGNDTSSSIAWERIVDTLIGAMAALAASYFVFPSWESYQIKTALQKMALANTNYLRSILERNQTQANQSAYRLARKDVYVQTANLSTALQRMLSEPKSKQKFTTEINSFMVLNNQLSSYLATLSYLLNPNEELSDDYKKRFRSVYFVLNETLQKLRLDSQADIQFANGEPTQAITNELVDEIYKTVTDIKKIAESIEE
jgi:uncharacterized membrane protein (TIGR01666 family)